MQTDSAGIEGLWSEVAALQVLACGMRHERIANGPDGTPLRGAASETGYQRSMICPAARRARHLGCSHTTARLVLQRALDALGDDMLGDDLQPLRDTLQTLDGEIGRLDHRRYDAESRRADAVLAANAADVTAADDAIAALVRDHRALGRRVEAVRNAILARLDAATAGPPSRAAPERSGALC